VISVLLADDQALVRGGFRLILDAEPDIEVIAEAADGGQAIDEALQARPDVVLMDIRMPALDGIQATRQMVRNSPPWPHQRRNCPADRRRALDDQVTCGQRSAKTRPA